MRCPQKPGILKTIVLWIQRFGIALEPLFIVFTYTRAKKGWIEGYLRLAHLILFMIDGIVMKTSCMLHNHCSLEPRFLCQK